MHVIIDLYMYTGDAKKKIEPKSCHMHVQYSTLSITTIINYVSIHFWCWGCGVHVQVLGVWCTCVGAGGVVYICRCWGCGVHVQVLGVWCTCAGAGGVVYICRCWGCGLICTLRSPSVQSGRDRTLCSLVYQGWPMVWSNICSPALCLHHVI